MTLKIHVPQCGVTEIITDENGDGSIAVVLKDPIDGEYVVHADKQEADDTGILDLTSKLSTGFTLGIDASSLISTEVIDASSVAITLNDNTQEVIAGGSETVTFAEVGATGDTITRASGGWSRYITAGDIIVISGSASNDGTYEIASLSNTVLTMDTDDLAAETFNSGNLTITVVSPLKPDTIVRGSGDWATIFDVGDLITISDNGSDINAGTYTITAIATVTMTLTLATDSVTQEANTTDDFTFVSDDGVTIGWSAQKVTQGE